MRERVDERERKDCVVKCEDMKTMNDNEEDEHCAEPIEQKRNEDEEEELLCWMQYAPGLFERLKKRLWREAKVRLRFSKNPTIGNMLSKVKRRTAMLEKRGVVYAFDCDCGKSYIGETGRTLEERMNEHKGAIRRMMKKSHAI